MIASWGGQLVAHRTCMCWYGHTLHFITVRMGTTDRVLYISELPEDVSLYILRQLEAWELVAACLASSAWAALAQSDELWRHACEYRWPHTFCHSRLPLEWGQGPGSAPPLAMPSWLRRNVSATVYHFDLPHPHLREPPVFGDSAAKWREYYLEHDVYEAMNEAPHWLGAETLTQLYVRLRHALRWCSPFLRSATAELGQPVGLLGGCRHLQHLSLAYASHKRVRPMAVNVTDILHSLATDGGCQIFAGHVFCSHGSGLSQLHSLWLVDMMLRQVLHKSCTHVSPFVTRHFFPCITHHFWFRLQRASGAP